MDKRPPESSSQPKRRPSLVVTLAALAFVLVPFLFWEQTWYGRRLKGAEIANYLQDTAHPRHIQHALIQMSEHMAAGDSAVRSWYPLMVDAARNPAVEIRTTAAWVMGQDNASDLLHGALVGMLHDPELLVRRNAALALVRFHDPAGRPELLGMLAPYPLTAPAAGVVSLLVRAGQEVDRRTVLARIVTPQGRTIELMSPLRGRVDSLFQAGGSSVAANAPVVSLSTETDDVWEALRALYLIGQPADLASVEEYAHGVPGMPARIREQAEWTARAIQTRPAPSPTR